MPIVIYECLWWLAMFVIFSEFFFEKNAIPVIRFTVFLITIYTYIEADTAYSFFSWGIIWTLSDVFCSWLVYICFKGAKFTNETWGIKLTATLKNDGLKGLTYYIFY